MQLTAHYLTNALVSFSNHSRASSSTPSNNGPTFLLTSSLYSLSHSNSSGDKSFTSTKLVEMGTYCVGFGPSAISKKAEAWALRGRPSSRKAEVKAEREGETDHGEPLHLQELRPTKLVGRIRQLNHHDILNPNPKRPVLIVSCRPSGENQRNAEPATSKNANAEPSPGSLDTTWPACSFTSL